MIRLVVEDYCHECRTFEAEVHGPSRYVDASGNDVIQTNTVVMCANHKRCESIKRYVEKQLKEKGNG